MRFFPSGPEPYINVSEWGTVIRKTGVSSYCTIYILRYREFRATVLYISSATGRLELLYYIYPLQRGVSSYFTYIYPLQRAPLRMEYSGNPIFNDRQVAPAQYEPQTGPSPA